MSVHQANAWQKLIDRLFGASEPAGGGVEEEAAKIRFDSRQVRKILKGRRLLRTRRVFHGFDSPPGRF